MPGPDRASRTPEGPFLYQTPQNTSFVHQEAFWCTNLLPGATNKRHRKRKRPSLLTGEPPGQGQVRPSSQNHGRQARFTPFSAPLVPFSGTSGAPASKKCYLCRSIKSALRGPPTEQARCHGGKTMRMFNQKQICYALRS